MTKDTESKGFILPIIWTYCIMIQVTNLSRKKSDKVPNDAKAKSLILVFFIRQYMNKNRNDENYMTADENLSR